MITLDTIVTLHDAEFYGSGISEDPAKWSGPLWEFFEDNGFFDEGIGNRTLPNDEGEEILADLEKQGWYLGGGGAAELWFIRVS
jgi:hypothetical protein